MFHVARGEAQEVDHFEGRWREDDRRHAYPQRAPALDATFVYARGVIEELLFVKDFGLGVFRERESEEKE